MLSPLVRLHLSNFLLYHDDSFDSVTNTLMLNASVEYILSSRRFDGPRLYNFIIIIYALFCKAAV